MTNELFDSLQAANRAFQQFVGQVSETAANPAEIPATLSLLEQVDLLLKDVSRCLGPAPQSLADDPRAVDQFLNYRENLKALEGSMQSLQINLQAEKTRLENAQGNMKAVQSWAASVRATS